MTDYISIIVASISLFGTLVTSAIAAWVSFYQDDRRRRQDIEAVKAKYRDPLALACQDLQTRVRDLVDEDIAWWIIDERKDYLLQHTCFLFGQFLAWTHILRREVQFLSSSTDKSNQLLMTILRQVHHTLNQGLSESDFGPCLLYTGEQQALGELMTVDDAGQPLCIGYATFCEKWKKDQGFQDWFKRLLGEVESYAVARVDGDVAAIDGRLRVLQHLLLDLMQELDPRVLQFYDGYTRRCILARGCLCRECEGRITGEGGAGPLKIDG
ncbi:hypothetical protein JAAARDRAFT_60733 [Jaapia argillacea MUCL 33604]|uniref:Uncharacterized protein n=1 Tax=Jaapia argillacea MUCL 33604 TaxID=933084 RepID=A0A067PSQ0_9AGAM|nr:hypothetical protein JAAARDRAFT_60733 [Jaapia argillacea MUCL 33604]